MKNRVGFLLLFMLTLLQLCAFKNAGATELLDGSFSFDRTTVAVGETITVTWDLSGGKPPYSVNTYYWVVKEEGSERDIYEDSGSGLTAESLSFTPTKGNALRLELHLQDSENRVLSFNTDWVPVTGAATVEQLAGKISFDKASVAAGETITVTWDLSGGKPPYSVNTYYWVVKEEGSKRDIYEDSGSSLTAESLSFTPTKGNALRLELHLQDSENRVLSFNTDWVPVTGAATVEQLAGKISFDKASVAAGETITVTWNLSGGKPPYSVNTYYWVVKEEGSKRDIYEDSGSSLTAESLSFTPTKGNALRLELHLQDSEKRVLSFNTDWVPVRDKSDPEPNPGDANGDGKIDLQDLVALIDYLVSGKAPASMTNANADGSADGVIDLQDLVWIIDEIVGG
ncbi:MAG: dockerin type I domain-containing protein [Christensenellales bacterium]